MRIAVLLLVANAAVAAYADRPVVDVVADRILPEWTEADRGRTPWRLDDVIVLSDSNGMRAMWMFDHDSGRISMSMIVYGTGVEVVSFSCRPAKPGTEEYRQNMRDASKLLAKAAVVSEEAVAGWLLANRDALATKKKAAEYSPKPGLRLTGDGNLYGEGQPGEEYTVYMRVHFDDDKAAE